MYKMEVSHKEEYSSGKKIRNDIVISKSYHYTTTEGFEHVTQRGIISVASKDLQDLITKLQAFLPRANITSDK